MLGLQSFLFMVGVLAVLTGGPLWITQVRRVISGDEYVPLRLILSALALAFGLALIGGVVLWLSLT